MSSLDAATTELGLAVLYLNKAEARDKICRAIQYGSRFLSDGKPGTAQDVEKSTSLARKVFRLFKVIDILSFLAHLDCGCPDVTLSPEVWLSGINLQFINDLHDLISPAPHGTPLALVLLGKSKNALLSTFLFLDQIVWLGRSGIYKNKERSELLGRISLFCWMGSSICSALVELGELARVTRAIKKINNNMDKTKNDEYRSKVQKSNERSLALIKALMDIVVAVGLLRLSPTKVTPRVSGAFGFVTSLISCYQLLPPPPAKSKAL